MCVNLTPTLPQLLKIHTALTHTTTQHFLHAPAHQSGEDESPQFEAYFQKALWKEYIFSIKLKQEQVRDEMRKKATAIKVWEVDPRKEEAKMVEAVKKYSDTAVAKENVLGSLPLPALA